MMSTMSCLYHCNLLLTLFFFNNTPTTEIYTLSLHDALPILKTVLITGANKGIGREVARQLAIKGLHAFVGARNAKAGCKAARSEEHTSELQSHSDLVCRLLLEKKKKKE